MRKIVLIISAVLFAACCKQSHENGELIIEKQGSFTISGNTIVRSGVYDNGKFVGWSQQEETGQSFRGDHAYVHYQIPKHAGKYPLVYVHGFGGSGVCWEMSPDDRDGFTTLMLKRGFSSYVMDLPGRGRASRTTHSTEIKPIADEMFWFDIWRIGTWPDYNQGVQFSKDSAYLSQFFREMCPDVSDHTQDIPSINALVGKIGENILVTHSAGGVPGWIVASTNPNVKAVVAYEPGAFVFPEDDMPEAIDGKTGGTQPIPITKEQFMQLTKIPIVMYFGDYIPEEVSDKLGDENWRVRLQMARKFVEKINNNGGKATLVELPKQGIKGNTHFLMQDLNNDILADLLAEWLQKNNLK